MNVETILRTKGSAVATIRPDQTVGAAVKELISRNVGALVVSEDGETVDGIISERDLVHGLADHGAGLLSLKVAEMMTQRVVTCELSDTVDQLMAEMTNRRIRHFPVRSFIAGA
jgi:CBS domain-containing protein